MFLLLRYGALALIAALLCAGARADASPTYSNPFHPEQCEIAIAAAKRALTRDAGSGRAQTILAEGLLCRGLSQDDPGALDGAMAALQELSTRRPSDFFLQLYRAEALRHRYPLADLVVLAFRQAADTLAHADVGAARGALAAHLEAARAAVDAHRAQFLPQLGRLNAELDGGKLDESKIGDLATLLAQTGPDGVERALVVVGTSERLGASAVRGFYRAELLRGRLPAMALAPLYRAAERSLCRDSPRSFSNECGRARRRLSELEHVDQSKGGSR